jgi:hypothetical protein
VRGYVIGDRGGVVDGGGAGTLDDRQAARRPGRDDLGAASEGQLDGHVPGAAGAAVDEDPLAAPEPGPVDQALPRRDHGERERRGLAHVSVRE